MKTLSDIEYFSNNLDDFNVSGISTVVKNIDFTAEKKTCCGSW